VDLISITPYEKKLYALLFCQIFKEKEMEMPPIDRGYWKEYLGIRENRPA
jgi:hypothetical protein